MATINTETYVAFLDANVAHARATDAAQIIGALVAQVERLTEKIETIETNLREPRKAQSAPPIEEVRTVNLKFTVGRALSERQSFWLYLVFVFVILSSLGSLLIKH